MEVEPKPQQDAFLENSRGHCRVTDRPEQDHIAAPKARDVGFWQHLTGCQIPLAPEIKPFERVLKAVKFGHVAKNCKAFPDDLGTDPITWNHTNPEQSRLRRTFGHVGLW